MEDKLTTQKYWEKYYEHNKVSEKNIITVCSYYDEIWEKFFRRSEEKKTLIEIGGFPGRYLAYLGKKYNLEPTCLDYNTAIGKIKNSFKVMNVPKYHIIQEDFTTYKSQKKYDYVMSNGFIEHFENYETIMDLHLHYLADNGRLLIMIPNMRGYIKFYKYLVDYKNLKVHNLKCMELKLFSEFAKRHDLIVLHLDYFGGFHFNIHQKINLMQKIFYKANRAFFKYFANERLEKKPSKYFSSSIIAIFEKK